MYRAGSPLTVDKGDVVHFEFIKSLTEQVGEGYVKFDNAKTLDYRAGDEIRIYWGSEGTGIYTLVFCGEVDLAQKEYDEEEAQQYLKLTFMDWGKILLETKIDKSYPYVTQINTIIEEILASVATTNDPPYPSERKINITHVSSLYKTRTVDFVGESLWDCLRKLAFITQSEFYVDENKRLQFFAKGANTTGETLTIDDFIDYRYRTNEENIANTIRVFGHPNRPYPLDKDLWTENDTPITYFLNDGSSRAPVISKATFSYTKAGTIAISSKNTFDTGDSWNMNNFYFYFPEGAFDLSRKESYKALCFSFCSWCGQVDPPGPLGATFSVHLIDTSGNRVRYDAGHNNVMWWQGTGVYKPHVELQDFRIPVGPDHYGDGEWELYYGSTFNWNSIWGVSFRTDIKTNSVEGYHQCMLDWLHWDEGKWFGVTSDTTSMTDPPTGYGKKYIEIFDETIYSNTAAQRWATEYLAKYKDPTDFLFESEIEKENMERGEPGDIYTVSLPELASAKNFKIKDMSFSWDEEAFFEILITLEEAK